MKKSIKKLSFVVTILLLLYIFLIVGFDVLWMGIGGEIFYYFPGLPLTDDYTGTANFVPSLLALSYVLLSSIYFIRKGYKGLKI